MSNDSNDEILEKLRELEKRNRDRENIAPHNFQRHVGKCHCACHCLCHCTGHYPHATPVMC